MPRITAYSESKLDPMMELKGNDLWDAWLQCIYCHYHLWKKGVHHREVNCGNFMYCSRGNNLMGVLNDFDLASIYSPDGVRPRDHQRTGTPPFMALDLLDDDQIENSYRHDLESFVCVRRRRVTLVECRKVQLSSTREALGPCNGTLSSFPSHSTQHSRTSSRLASCSPTW
ncbi:hypothetical protein F5I97DRAFT_348436 [Phlebopus sp. FC_14]|nr:hypothetical protein F5I97DRAFT_348436 [Phlebopus sp. FC_14]